MTKEEAIKHLHTYSSTNGSGLTTQDQHEEAKKMAIKALETQLRWIPCSERFPEDGDYKPFSYYDDGAVLFCTKDGKIGFGWYYESTKQWANEDDKSPGEVIKWMPIPG